MTSGEPDQVVELHDFPRQDVGAPLPLVLADDGHLVLAYYTDEGAGWEDRAAIVLFPVYASFRLGGPNDEALEGHPLAARGLEPYGVYEVRQSSWIAELERVNSVHELHDARRYAALRHLVFTFHDRMLECVVPRWHVERADGSHGALIDRMSALLRHESGTKLPLQRGDRMLPTTIQVPSNASDGPLVVFAHGWFGHPRKFARLFRAWAEAGITVAAPAFPLTNDEAPGALDFDDVVRQPADVSFVIDELLAARDIFPFDPERIGVAGFSLGGATALAVGFHRRHRDPRVRAVLSLAGRFHEAFGGDYEMTETPLLVVHGTQDKSVPYEKGLVVYEAAQSPKQLLTIEGPHDVCEDTSPHLDEVIAVTTAFWQEHLGPAA